MNPLKALQGMMTTKDAIEAGVVVSVSSTGIKVRGKTGLKSFSIPNASSYSPGDHVRYSGNLLLGKSIPADSIPVFYV